MELYGRIFTGIPNDLRRLAENLANELGDILFQHTFRIADAENMTEAATRNQYNQDLLRFNVFDRYLPLLGQQTFDMIAARVFEYYQPADAQ